MKCKICGFTIRGDTSRGMCETCATQTVECPNYDTLKAQNKRMEKVVEAAKVQVRNYPAATTEALEIALKTYEEGRKM